MYQILKSWGQSIIVYYHHDSQDIWAIKTPVLYRIIVIKVVMRTRDDTKWICPLGTDDNMSKKGINKASSCHRIKMRLWRTCPETQDSSSIQIRARISSRWLIHHFSRQWKVIVHSQYCNMITIPNLTQPILKCSCSIAHAWDILVLVWVW